ncbi:MAG: DNA-3-methyladenine glycosylase [Bacteroidetes bacterium HGW-Bacteroidetes-17]|jgi:DNA-3-methyladenine glycosylase|nr:MAG: DNA-3-methyladenine glycosylase [Bacteroidetes bacterium HGW-Bacteroidetes-17]
MKLEKQFFLSENVVEIARDLIGKYLFVNNDGVVCGGYITETEAYAGATDKASHAYQNRRTNRTEVMFKKGGRTYVYLCYGMHALLNFVTAEENVPHAVLIRGFWPTHGIDTILSRLGKQFAKPSFFNGPGKLTKALGIKPTHNDLDLQRDQIWIEDLGLKILNNKIEVGPRIGVGYAGTDALLPYRFVLKP